MKDWDTIIENYESNDCESLGEYAAELMDILIEDYFKNFESSDDAVYDCLLCALYFVNIDRFVDGGEEDVLRNAMGAWDLSRYNFPLLLRKYQEQGLANRVERNMRDAPSRIREVFVRLGCAICSGKGYVSSDERRAILRWVD